MRIFKTSEIAKIDQYTIMHEPISDIDLMERASITVVNYIIGQTSLSGSVSVFCGPGNNGGDGLAVARLLAENNERFQVQVFILSFNKELGGSPAINLQRLFEQGKTKITFLNESMPLPILDNNSLVIDALFGSGLNRPLAGFTAKLVQHINASAIKVLSIDIPSGLMGEDNTNNTSDNIIRANTTVTFQFPKLSFFMAENEVFVGNWLVTDIGLLQQAILNTPTNFYYNNYDLAKQLIKTRNKFSHKGTFGHALLISGSSGKIGAAVLASKACLRAGVGLLTTHVPQCGYQIIQTAVPEAMASIDQSTNVFSSIENTNMYNAIAIGPGIGTSKQTANAFKTLLDSKPQTLIIDADAINILGEYKEWLTLLPESSILTPHPKEFERLAGKAENSYQRMLMAVDFAIKYKVIIVLKGAYTIVVNRDGELWFNSTGNPGMATAGSGDTLTGILLSLVAQGYSSFDAARFGVYLHGLAADIAVKQKSVEALIASDIIEYLGEAYQLLHK